MTTNEISYYMNQKMTNELFDNLQSVQRKSISDTIRENLIDLIMDEVIKPGYIFPNENDMCEKLNISRSTLREVYSALEAMGFLTRTKKGTVLNNISRIRSAIPLSYLFRKADTDEIMEFRIMIEAQVAYLAAKFMDDSTITELENVLERMKKNNGNDIDSLTQLDMTFHYTLAVGCNNRLLLNTLSAVTYEIHRSAYSGYDVDPETTISHSINYHSQILEAVKSHNQKLCREAMRNHIKDIYTILRKNLL